MLNFDTDLWILGGKLKGFEEGLPCVLLSGSLGYAIRCSSILVLWTHESRLVIVLTQSL